MGFLHSFVDSRFFKVFQTLVQIGFILAIIVFVGVALDTGGKVMDLKKDIREGRCVPYDLHTPKSDGNVLPSLNVSKNMTNLSYYEGK